MKKSHLVFLCLLFFSFFVIYSCRRDVQNFVSGQSAPSGALESAKIWRAMNSSSNAINLEALWSASWTLNTQSGKILVVPAPEHPLDNIDYTIRRVFLFSLSGNQVTKGEIVEFMGHKYDVSSNLDNLITAYYEGRNMDKFSGSIYEYDINYTQVNNAVYENGSKNLNVKSELDNLSGAQMKTKIQAFNSKIKVNDIADVTYYPTLPWPHTGEGCTTTYNTAYYYSNGRLTDIIVTLVSQVCPPSSSSGGGSGSSSSSGNNNPPYGGFPPGLPGGGPPPVNTKSPCEEVKTLNGWAATQIFQNMSATIKDQSFGNISKNIPATGNEWGYKVRLTAWNDNSPTNPQPLTQSTLYNSLKQPGATDIYGGTPTSWPQGPFYFDSTHGFVIGVAHTHPNKTFPDPPDIMVIVNWETATSVFNNLGNQAANANAFYRQNAFSYTETEDGDIFIVTVNDWARATGPDGLEKYNNNPNAAKLDWNAKLSIAEDADGDPGRASIVALEQVYPNMFNFYIKRAGSNKFTPYKVNPGQNVASQINC